MNSKDIESRCELTELYVSQCAHCRKLMNRRPSKVVGTWLRARYTGRCVDCDDYIFPGEEIRSVDDGYLCNACGLDFVNA